MTESGIFGSSTGTELLIARSAISMMGLPLCVSGSTSSGSGMNEELCVTS